MTITPTRRRLATALVAATAAATLAPAAAASPVAPLDPPVFDVDAQPSFDWSMPERYDASWASYNAGTGKYNPYFVNPKTWSIRLNACSSTAERRITGYVFTINRPGTTWTRTFTSSSCTAKYDALPGLGAYDVRLSLRTDWGTSVGVSEQVRRAATLRDHLIVSMGDSLASGEGNPDVRGDYQLVGSDRPAQWKDERCHRSALSGPALAAKAIEKADPRSSVTFVSVACSGAKIPHVSHRDYTGIEPQGGVVLPGQVEQVAKLVGPDSLRGGRRISAILLAAGVNDLYFSGVIERCAKLWTGDGCVRWADRLANLAGLPASYHRLAVEIARQLPSTNRVLVNNYPVHLFKDGACGLLRGIWESKGDEIAKVGELLNRAIYTAIRAHVDGPYRWKAITDLDAPFTPHPYCGSSTWFTRLEWSLRHQGDELGAAHPNGPGHRAYAGFLRSGLQSIL